MPEKKMTGKIVTASFEDGVDRGAECGLEDCECPEHSYGPRPAGTYILVHLDEDYPIGVWRVSVSVEEPAS